ncbi:MAG: MotA/TolQ/ExbB proton channel family protein [Paraclostridium sordellii]
MGKIIINLFTSVFTNPITITFIGITIVYLILIVIKNNNIYYFINEKLRELNLNQDESTILTMANVKYESYKSMYPYAEINMNSFIEEVISDFSKDKKIIIDEIKFIKNAPSVCILLGVLGTFVGLTITLASIDKGDIISSMTNAIGSMQIAFTTSIVGIVCSIILNACIKLKNCENTLLQLMLKVENLMTVKSSHSKGEVLDSKLNEIKVCIRDISKAISAIERFDKISKDLHDFNDDFISSIEKLGIMLNGSHESIKTFDQSIRKLDKQFSILNLKFVKLFDTYESQSDIFSEIAVSIKESEKNIKFVNQSQITIKDYIKDINAGFALYERNIQDLMMKLINHENSLLVKENSIKNINVNLSSDINNLSKIIDNQADSITNKLDLVFKYIDLYKEAMDISKAIEDNSDLLETFEEEKISKLDDLYELENTNQTFDLDELDEEELEYD